MPEVVDGAAGLKEVFREIAADWAQADYTPVLEELTPILQEDTFQLFQQEKSASGDAWPKLAPATVKRKGREDILVDTGRLERSLTTESGDSIRDIFREGNFYGYVYGTSVEYAHFHQSGTKTMPKRQPVGMIEVRIREVEADIVTHAALSLRRE